jgi:tryptophanyl-tRNA synthetase
MPSRPRSLSGIKPTGQPHWGNYFGMIQPALEMARDHEAFYFIADYHALTTVRDAGAMKRDTLEIAATLLASGLDPSGTVLWRQSDVPEVCELAWHLACVTGYGLIERAHAVKDARAHQKEINFGIVSYPVLMAADILLYDSDVVPVGRDQLQHIEMARDMTVHFNQHFLGTSCIDEAGKWTGQGLKRPESSFQEATATVAGLDGHKMSKSYDNTIPIFGTDKAIKKRIMAIVTDSTALEDPKDPDTCNVFQLHKLFADATELADLADRYRAGGFGYGHAKLELFERSRTFFAESQERFDALMADPSTLEDILQDGAARARAVAREVLGRVREATGLPTLPGA